jgi:hypothetical protein
LRNLKAMKAFFCITPILLNLTLERVS